MKYRSNKFVDQHLSLSFYNYLNRNYVIVFYMYLKKETAITLTIELNAIQFFICSIYMYIYYKSVADLRYEGDVAIAHRPCTFFY